MDSSTCLNNASPLLLPVRNNPVSVDNIGSARGVAITLGDPSQFFSMMPLVDINNTFVSDSNDCYSTNHSCIASRGGVYSPSANAQKSNSYASWNGSVGGDEFDGSSFVYWNDLMTVEGHNIPGLPFYSFQSTDDSTPIQSGLSIGSNSSFIRAATDLGFIPSKKWGLWGGSELYEIDGHVILGGYDKNRIAGDFTTFQIDPPDALWLYVEDVQWAPSSGSTSSLLDGTGFVFTSTDAVLEPFFDRIELPSAVWKNFLTATNASTDAASGLPSYPSRPFGSLVITLSNGMVVNVTAENIFDRGKSFNSNGLVNTSTYNFYTPKVYEGYENYAVRFGAPFFAQKYVVADFDNAQFHLADAVQGVGDAVDVQPLCTGGPTPTPGPPSGKKTNAAAIGGGVGGGVGALLIIALVVFFILRQRRNKKQKPSDKAVGGTDDVKSPDQPPPQYASGVPAPATGYAEKDGTSPVTKAVTASEGTASNRPSGIGELPSPDPGISRTSQGFQYQHEQVPTTYLEMPAENYR